LKALKLLAVSINMLHALLSLYARLLLLTRKQAVPEKRDKPTLVSLRLLGILGSVHTTVTINRNIWDTTDCNPVKSADVLEERVASIFMVE
jgi:hypothetical protein